MSKPIIENNDVEMTLGNYTVGEQDKQQSVAESRTADMLNKLLIKMLIDEVEELKKEIAALEKRITAVHRYRA